MKRRLFLFSIAVSLSVMLANPSFRSGYLISVLSPAATSTFSTMNMSFHNVNWSAYHGYSEIKGVLFALNSTFPSLIDVFELGRSWRDESIYCVRLTNENLFFDKPKLLFVGYHHAREPITAELALYFVVWTAENYGTNETATRMLDLAEVYVILALNVDGFELIRSNDWQRKNARPVDEDGDGLIDEDPPEDVDGDGGVSVLVDYRGRLIEWEGFDNDGDGLFNEDWVGGVDLNRNYCYAWNASTMSGSVDPRHEDYKGPYPFSEPETRVLRDLALNHSFAYAVSFHSGAEVIVYPWFYTNVSTEHDHVFRQVAGNLSEIVGVPYAQGGRGLYTSSGIWDDWMYGNRSVVALTCEVYRDDNAWVTKQGPNPGTYWISGILNVFNPLPSKIHATLQRWLPAFIYLTNRAIDETMSNRDVEVLSVAAETWEAYEGWTIKVNVTLRNNGDECESFNVTLYCDEEPVETLSVENFAPKSLQTITFTLDTSNLTPCKNYEIWAEAGPLPGEYFTENNRGIGGFVKMRMRGDVNGDSSVNIIDLAMIAVLMGKSPVHEDFALCDLNRDQQINILDIAIAAADFGRACPGLDHP